MPKRLLLRYLLPLLIVVAAVAVFQWLRATRPAQPAPTPQAKVWQVAVQVVFPATRAPTSTLFGRVETPARVQPAAPGSGVVAAAAVREGERFAAGARLVALDERDFAPALAQARAELADLDAQLAVERRRGAADRAALAEEERLLTLAEAAVARAERLKRQKLGSDTAVDDARAALARQRLTLNERQYAVAVHAARVTQIEARRARQRARVDDAALALERSVVTAPFAGVVAALPVAVGSRVAAGAPLIDIYPLAGLEVRARIATVHVAALRRALADGTTPRARTAFAGRTVELPLTRLAGIADPSGLDAFFAVPADAGVPVGALLELQLERPAVAGVVAVPYRALYGDNRLYLLRDGRLAGIDVTLLGPADDDPQRVLVTGPAIAAGDRVVVTHLPNAVTGLPVEALDP